MSFPGKHVSTFGCPNRVITPFKSASPGNAFGNVRSTLQNLRLGGGKVSVEIKDDSMPMCLSNSQDDIACRGGCYLLFCSHLAKSLKKMIAR
jgi:hypothetical protein